MSEYIPGMRSCHRGDIHPWTAEETAQFMEHIADGRTIRQAGRLIGRSGNSAIGKWRREIERMGWQCR